MTTEKKNGPLDPGRYQDWRKSTTKFDGVVNVCVSAESVNGRGASMNTQNNDLIIRSATKGAGYFTQICNEFLRDPDIPFDEKGFLAYLRTFSSNWRITFAYILANNNKLGLKGLRSLIRRLEGRGYIAIIPQRRNEKGVYENPVVIASDDREIVKRRREAHEAMIAGTAQAIADAMDGAFPPPPTPKGNPVENEPPTPSRQAATRPAVTAPPKNKKATNKNEKEKKISLSAGASAPAAERERGASLDELFEWQIGELFGQGCWNTATDESAVRNELAKQSPAEREHAVAAAPRYAEERRQIIAGDPKQKRYNLRLETWLARRAYKAFPDAIAEYVRGLPSVTRSTLANLLRYYFVEIHEYGQQAHWRHDVPFDQIPPDLIAEVEAPIKQRANEKAAAERAEMEDAFRDPHVQESIIHRLCSYLCPEMPTQQISGGFRRGEWRLKGPTPDQPGCWYEGEIIQEAQRRNVQTLTDELGVSGLVELLDKIRTGRAKWDAVRFGPIQQVEALSARAA